MCRVLNVHRGGFYAWLKEPQSKAEKANLRLLKQIQASYVQSGGVYGSPRITHELRRSGESCGENRVAKLMKQAKLKANIGYKRRYFKSSTPHIAADNHLLQQFVVCEPDTAWVSDITYIKTNEGWLYLAVVLDLFSRKVIGWSMQQTMTTGIVIKALLMAVWRRPKAKDVIAHSDLGSQYASGDYLDFLAAHNLIPSMSRRDHCLDNAVAEGLSTRSRLNV
tara:strand:- start:6 stop:671 length:666 start_codon:yes stop_codon:yes gene_type:complete